MSEGNRSLGALGDVFCCSISSDLASGMHIDSLELASCTAALKLPSLSLVDTQAARLIGPTGLGT